MTLDPQINADDESIHLFGVCSATLFQTNAHAIIVTGASCAWHGLGREEATGAIVVAATQEGRACVCSFIRLGVWCLAPPKIQAMLFNGWLKRQHSGRTHEASQQKDELLA